MTRVSTETEISSKGGLFFQIDAKWPGVTLELPTITTPVRAITGDDYPDDSTRDIVDAYVPVSSGDLDEYRELQTDPDSRSEASAVVQDILKKFTGSIPQEVKVLFFEYTETQPIPKEDVRTMIEILGEYSDIVPKPLQPKLTDAIKSDGNVFSGYDFDATPFRAYRTTVEDFLEIGGDCSKPLMMTLSSIGFSRLQEVSKTLIDSGVTLFAYDWEGRKPSKEENYGQILDLMKHLGKQGQAADQIFYSLNHEKYHPVKNRSHFPAEAIALVGMGFSIIGGSFKSSGGGGEPAEYVKIFDPVQFWYEDIPFSADVEDYPVSSSIDLGQIAVSGHTKNQNLRKLVNFESISYSLKKLRKAIQDGTTRSMLERKRGYSGSVREAMQAFATGYDNATGPSPDDERFSSS